MMNSCTLNEVPCLEYLLKFKITPDLKWNSDIQSIAKDAANIQLHVMPEKVPVSPCCALSLHESDQNKNGELLPHLGQSCPILTF